MHMCMGVQWRGMRATRAGAGEVLVSSPGEQSIGYIRDHRIRPLRQVTHASMCWWSGVNGPSGRDRAHPCRRPPQRRSAGGREHAGDLELGSRHQQWSEGASCRVGLITFHFRNLTKPLHRHVMDPSGLP